MEEKEFGVCCTTCQLYWTCETKWYRGERGEEHICCKLCNLYQDCQMKSVLKKIRLKKKIETVQI